MGLCCQQLIGSESHGHKFPTLTALGAEALHVPGLNFKIQDIF